MSTELRKHFATFSKTMTKAWLACASIMQASAFDRCLLERITQLPDWAMEKLTALPEMRDKPAELVPSLTYITTEITRADWRLWIKQCQPKQGASLPFTTASELRASHQAWQASTRPTKNKGKAAGLESRETKDNAALENNAALEHQEEPMGPRRSSRTRERLQGLQQQKPGQREGHANGKKRPRDDDSALAANKKQKRRVCL